MSAKHVKGDFENKKGLSVEIRNNNIEGGIRILGRKVKSEGLLREIRDRRFYEHPSEKRRRKRQEAVIRHRRTLAQKEN